MDLLAVTLVLLAALLHALWNVLVKQQGDRLLALLAMSLASGLIASLALPFVEPLPRPAWPYLLVSAILHAVYKLFLAQGYRHGDLAQVYPVARGAAPLVVALLALIVAGETLGRLQFLAVLLIALAVMSLAFREGIPAGRDAKAIGYALGTALLIAGYTVVDGLGARAAGAPFSFAVQLFVLEAWAFAALVIPLRGRAAWPYLRSQWRSGLVSGVFSQSAYVLVIWALTLADMALVSALRETSVLFAALLGTLLLRETLGAWRISCAAVIVLELVLLQG
ncbi:MAG: DMT family transporter [Rhodospirillales bacterium]|nr:DMT family transporter [Rhodospirillales bacterium]